jgi:hypothetical protein
LSFAAGIAVMLYSVTAQGQIDLPLSMIGLAIGQADLGGVL